jgi:hypothetical protein
MCFADPSGAPIEAQGFASLDKVCRIAAPCAILGGLTAWAAPSRSRSAWKVVKRRTLLAPASRVSGRPGLLLDLVPDDGRRRAADAGDEVAPAPENGFSLNLARSSRSSLRRSRPVAALKLTATALRAHFGFRHGRKWTWSSSPLTLMSSACAVLARRCGDILESLEHCAGAALASLLRGEDELMSGQLQRSSWLDTILLDMLDGYTVHKQLRRSSAWERAHPSRLAVRAAPEGARREALLRRRVGCRRRRRTTPG